MVKKYIEGVTEQVKGNFPKRRIGEKKGGVGRKVIKTEIQALVKMISRR